jgi:hypothetical protein
MNCSTCIWFQVYGFNYNNIKLICNKKEKYLPDVPEAEKCNCKDYKSKEDIEKDWKML